MNNQETKNSKLKQVKKVKKLLDDLKDDTARTIDKRKLEKIINAAVNVR